MRRGVEPRPGHAAVHAAAICAAAALGFAVSFIAADLASLPRDWFVLAHGVVTLGFLAVYARIGGVGAAALVARWPAGLLAGGAAAVFAVGYVAGQPASPGPDGAREAMSLLWLGLVYGAVDALLLSVVPVDAVRRIADARGWRDSRSGVLATAVIALLASAGVTAAYHLGFPEFRGAAIVAPVIGNGAFTLAYLLSGSPVAPLVGHVALHAAAVLHAFDTSAPLPPHY